MLKRWNTWQREMNKIRKRWGEGERRYEKEKTRWKEGKKCLIRETECKIQGDR